MKIKLFKIDLKNDLDGAKIMREIRPSNQMFCEKTQSSKTYVSLHDLLSITRLVKIPESIQRDTWTLNKLKPYESFVEIHQWINSGYYWSFIPRNSRGTIQEPTWGNPTNHRIVFKT